jgi:hypothetical protein
MIAMVGGRSFVETAVPTPGAARGAGAGLRSGAGLAGKAALFSNRLKADNRGYGNSLKLPAEIAAAS